MRWFAMTLVAAAGCSFPGNDVAGGDGPPGTPIDGPIGAIDAPDVDAPLPVIDAPRPPDASPPDAGFSAALCPGGYSNGSITASPNTRYRVIGLTDTFSAQHADCNDDSAAGWTHLAVLDTAAEAAQLGAAIGNTIYYVGAVQAPSQPSPSAGWFALTGGSLASGLWETGQPNDDFNGEGNQQNLAAGNLAGELNDVGGNYFYYAICECDGVPVDPTVASYIP